MSSKFGHIGPRTAELAALECLEKSPYTYNGRNLVNTLAPSFLAHLSRRLKGELIVYQWSGVCRHPYVVCRPQCSNILFSETTWPIKSKFYVEPPCVGGTKFFSRHLGHMTKMAATPIYGKNPSKIFFSRTGRPIFKKLGM